LGKVHEEFGVSGVNLCGGGCFEVGNCFAFLTLQDELEGMGVNSFDLPFLLLGLLIIHARF